MSVVKVKVSVGSATIPSWNTQMNHFGALQPNGTWSGKSLFNDIDIILNALNWESWAKTSPWISLSHSPRSIWSMTMDTAYDTVLVHLQVVLKLQTCCFGLQLGHILLKCHCWVRQQKYWCELFVQYLNLLPNWHLLQCSTPLAPVLTMLHPTGLCYNAPPHWPLLQCSTPLASATMLHLTGLCYNAPPHWPLLQCSTPLASVTMLHPTGLCCNAPPHWPLLQCSTPLASVTRLHPTGLCYSAPPHWPLLQCSTPLASVTMLHPTGLCYNAPPHWPLLQGSTPLASVTMLHPTALCYNAPPHWPLLQCSTPLVSVTMLHPTALCYNAPPQWPLLQCSTPMASVTMLHPTGLCYNAPSHCPLSQCSTPMASVTMLHPNGLCYNAPPHWPLLLCSIPAWEWLCPCKPMMTSSNGNVFCVTGPFCKEVAYEFLSQRPVTHSCDVFFDLAWINGWVNNWDAADLKCHCAHYDVTVMPPLACCRCPLYQVSKNGKGFILQQRMCSCDILKWPTMLPRWPAPHPGKVLLHTASWILLCPIKGLALAVWM